MAILIDRGLGALSADRRQLGLRIVNDHDVTVVETGAERFHFGRDARGRLLGWERLADALPVLVERSRLVAMHLAVDADWPAPWSVYMSETTLAWLAQGASDPVERRDRQRAILHAAGEDGDVTLLNKGESGQSTMTGILRSRHLRAKIALSDGIMYDSEDRSIVARDIVPDTVAIATGGRHVAEIVEVPWTAGIDIRITAASVGEDGTRLDLCEALVPLAPIPELAMRAAPMDGARYAPWLVTPVEREALDLVDAEAHRIF